MDLMHPMVTRVAPYILASRYNDDLQAHQAYFQLQDAIAMEPCDLSAYRLILEEHSFVAVLGETPDPNLDAHIQRVLATGTFRNLPEDVIRTLSARRALISQQSPWVEGRHRPGKRIRRDSFKQAK
jgi:hypothetical protein